MTHSLILSLVSDVVNLFYCTVHHCIGKWPAIRHIFAKWPVGQK